MNNESFYGQGIDPGFVAGVQESALMGQMASQNQKIVDLLQRLASIQNELLRERKMSSSEVSAPNINQAHNVASANATTQNRLGQYHFNESMSPVSFQPQGVRMDEFSQLQNNQQPVIGGGPRALFSNEIMISDRLRRMPREQKERYIDDRGAQISNTIMSGAGAGLSALGVHAGSSIGFAAVPGVGGMAAGGLLGAGMGVGIGAFFDNAVERAKIHQAYSKYLGRESYRFINPRESNNDRGYGGFSRKESQSMARFLHDESIDQYLEPEEMMKLLDGFTEGGLLKDVSDMETFRDKVSNLTESVRKGVVMLGESQEEITALLSDMKKMGIKDTDFTKLMSQAKTLGTELGKDASEIIRTMLDIVDEHIRGTSLSGDHYLGKYQDLSLGTNMLFEEYQKNLPNLTPQERSAYNFIVNNDGPEGASRTLAMMQDVMLEQPNNAIAMAAFFDHDPSDGNWYFNEDIYNQMIGSDMSLNQIYGIAERKLNAAGDLATREWSKNSTLYTKNALNEEQSKAISLMMARGMTLEMGGDPDANLSGIDEVFKGANPDQLNFYKQYLQNDFDLEGERDRMQAVAAWEDYNAGLIANRPTLLRELKKKGKKAASFLGGVGATFSDWVTDKYEKINDRLYGHTYTNLRFDDNLIDVERDDLGVGDTITGLTNSIKRYNDVVPDLIGRGYDISPVDIDYQSAAEKRDGYTYLRSVLSEDQFRGVASNYAKEIKEFGEKRGLSDTIIEALVRFSETPNGRKFFGADESIMKEIVAETGMSERDFGDSPMDVQIKIMADKLSKLTHEYGGNQELATRAFLEGREQVNAELKKIGIDVSKLSAKERPKVLQGVSSTDLGVTEKEKEVRDLGRESETFKTVGRDRVGTVVDGTPLEDFTQALGRTSAQKAEVIKQGTGKLTDGAKVRLSKSLDMGRDPTGRIRTIAEQRESIRGVFDGIGGRSGRRKGLQGVRYDEDSWDDILSAVDVMSGRTYSASLSSGAKKFAQERNLSKWYEETSTMMGDYAAGKDTEAAKRWRQMTTGERADSVMVVTALSGKQQSKELDMDPIDREVVEKSLTAEDREFSEKLVDGEYRDDRDPSDREKRKKRRKPAEEKWRELSEWQIDKKYRGKDDDSSISISFNQNAEEVSKEIMEQVEKLTKDRDTIKNTVKNTIVKAERKLREAGDTELLDTDKLDEALALALDGDIEELINFTTGIAKEKNRANKRIAEIRKQLKSGGKSRQEKIDLEDELNSLQKQGGDLQKFQDILNSLIGEIKETDLADLSESIETLKQLDLDLQDMGKTLEGLGKIGQILGDALYGEDSILRKEFDKNLNLDLLGDPDKIKGMNILEKVDIGAEFADKLQKEIERSFSGDFSGRLEDIFEKVPDSVKKSMLKTLAEADYGEDEQLATTIQNWVDEAMGDLSNISVEDLDEMKLPKEVIEEISSGFTQDLLKAAKMMNQDAENSEKSAQSAAEKLITSTDSLNDAILDTARGNLDTARKVKRLNERVDKQNGKQGFFTTIANMIRA